MIGATAMSVIRLDDAMWPDLTGRPLVIVPLGSLEQHGPHLPMNTDTAIATAVASCAAEQIDMECDRAVVIAPAIVYGASGEHQSFPGTVSLGHAALRSVLLEVVRSLSTWAGRIVIVNGHGGNVSTLSGAVAQMIHEGHDVAWVPCALAAAATDAHAGHDETSLMLHLAPERVDMPRASAGNTADLDDLMPALHARGMEAVSLNGVLGDPTYASSEAGEVLFSSAVHHVVSAIAHGSTRPADGLLRPPNTSTAGVQHADE